MRNLAILALASCAADGIMEVRLVFKMRTSQRIILTAVIAVLITGGFALLAYTGLFRILETDFFNSRVASDQKIRLRDISDTILLWNQENLSRFGALARDRNMQSVFSITQRQEEIFYRAQLSDSLKDQLLGFNGIRIVDNTGRIQFSSFAGDIGSSQLGTEGRILYRNWSETEDSFEFAIADEDSSAVTYYDEANQQVRYQLPIQDWGFVTRGWMLVYMDLSGLADRLARDGSIARGGDIYVVEDRGIIAGIRPEQAAAVKGEIDDLWPVDGAPPEFSVLAKGLDEKYWLGGTVSDDGTWVGKLIPGSLFGFSAPVRALILAAVFLTSALLAFLIFNFRQDRTEVLRGRIKRLQVNLLRDWLEHHEDRKLLLRDLEARREEVRAELRNGLGQLREEESTKADEIIDEGWAQIVEILAERESDISLSSVSTDAVAQQPPIDMKLLEDMIARAISAAQIAAPRARQPLQIRGGEALEEEEAPELVDELSEEVEESSELVDELSEEVEEAPEIADELSEEEEEAPELVDELSEEVEEAPEIAEDDAGPEESAELESDEMLDSSESAQRRMELPEDQTKIELDDAHSENEAAPEVFGVLPVVLADDFGELLEIDNVKQGRMYMFDGALDARDETGILETPGDES